jgi:hypothetical protein
MWCCAQITVFIKCVGVSCARAQVLMKVLDFEYAKPYVFAEAE